MFEHVVEVTKPFKDDYLFFRFSTKPKVVIIGGGFAGSKYVLLPFMSKKKEEGGGVLCMFVLIDLSQISEEITRTLFGKNLICYFLFLLLTYLAT